ncbi:hypothetical protein [Raoultibacter phocaeensis]|uniref:hypothetical protein n=1 Tax=Raoultibacter phocaeensis TaxID=2479841 RepID=UPI0011197202|nr:hypothetical protein [Raoultibacter phocaeensis]
MIDFLTPPSKRRGGRSLGACAQERVPLANVMGCAVLRSDGAVVSAVSVRGANLTGLTESERERLASVTEGALGADASRPFAILEMPRPADRSANHERVLARLGELERERRGLAGGKAPEGAGWSRIGEADALLADVRGYWLGASPDAGEAKYERDVYVAVETAPGPDALGKASARAADLAERISRCGFSAEVVCDSAALAMVKRYVCPNEPTGTSAGGAL